MVQVPVVVATVLVFIALGPVLHVLLSAFAADSPALFSLIFFVSCIYGFCSTVLALVGVLLLVYGVYGDT